MKEVTTSVRMPIILKKEAVKLINKGYYKNLSELMITALRDEIKECKGLTRDVHHIRKIKQQVWNDYLEKAKGNPKKAAKLMYEEDLKSYEEEPKFWK